MFGVLVLANDGDERVVFCDRIGSVIVATYHPLTEKFKSPFVSQRSEVFSL